MEEGEKKLCPDISKLFEDYLTEAAYKVVSYLFEDVYPYSHMEKASTHHRNIHRGILVH